MEKTASGLRMGGQLHVISKALLLKARIKVLERQDKLFWRYKKFLKVTKKSSQLWRILNDDGERCRGQEACPLTKNISVWIRFRIKFSDQKNSSSCVTLHPIRIFEFCQLEKSLNCFKNVPEMFNQWRKSPITDFRRKLWLWSFRNFKFCTNKVWILNQNWNLKNGTQ